MHRIAFGVLAACLLAACASQPQATIHLDPSEHPAPSPEEMQVRNGLEMIEAGQIMAAVDGPLTDVVNKFEAQYAHSKATIYSARGTGDALLYAAGNLGGSHGEVEVIGPAWAMAYWARGYAYGEMARYDDERRELEKALALAPFDAQYNNELAFVYMQKRDWPQALAHYENGEAFADITAPDSPNVKCVALRGQGYVLVEQHKLDEAEAKYRACLKVTPDEPKSLAEIGYIQDLRKKQH